MILTVPADATRHRRGLIVSTYRTVLGADPFFRYAALLVAAEFVAVFVSLALAMLLEVAVLLACVTEYVRRPMLPSRRVLPVLALVPIIRMLSLTMPLEDLPRWSAYVLSGAPLLVGTLLMTRQLGIRASDMALRTPTRPGLDATMVVMGIALGAAAVPLAAGPTVADGRIDTAILTIGALLLFVALPEELIFRGALHRLAAEAHGVLGIGMVVLLYAAMFLSSFSAPVVVIMGAAGMAFSWSIERGGSLWGAILGHACLIIGAALVWPAVLA